MKVGVYILVQIKGKKENGKSLNRKRKKVIDQIQIGHLDF